MQHTSIPSHPILNGSVPSLIYFPVTYNTTGISSGIRLAKIRASATAPVLLEFFAEVVTVFNAVTTNVLTVGSDTTATQFLGAADITEGTIGFYPAANATVKKRIVADTDIYVKYTQTGTAATTGAAVIFVQVTPLQPITSGYLGV